MECSCPPNQCFGAVSIYECRKRRLERLMASSQRDQIIADFFAGKYGALTVSELREVIDRRVRGLIPNEADTATSAENGGTLQDPQCGLS